MSVQDQELEMFEFDIADLPDLPSYEEWPAGAYAVEGVSLKARNVEIGNDTRPAVELTIKLEAVNAVKPADAKLPEIGTEKSYTFFLEGKDERGSNFAQGKIKQLLAPFKALTGGSGSLPDIARVIPGAKFNIVTSIRSGKLSPEQKAAGEEARIYGDIKNLFL